MKFSSHYVIIELFYRYLQRLLACTSDMLPQRCRAKSYLKESDQQRNNKKKIIFSMLLVAKI